MKSFIFSGDSVRLLIAGVKTQTRRLHDPSRHHVGDVVYVKETWRRSATDEIIYRADEAVGCASPVDWRSPLHLREADARLFIRIDAVRQERLQDISRADVIAEGVVLAYPTGAGDVFAGIRVTGKYPESDYIPRNPTAEQYARGKFAAHWDRINGRRAPSESNPTVIVYEFARVERPQ